LTPAKRVTARSRAEGEPSLHGAALMLALVVVGVGCSNSAATPDSICTRMISACSCFDESFRSYCVSTVEGYSPTQAQLDCAQSQPCPTLCNTTTLLATCYTRPNPDAGAPARDAGRDSAMSVDANAMADAGDVRDASVASDSGASADASTTPDGGASCETAVSCGACTAITGCGWCRNHSSCVAGTPSGPTGGSCPGSQWSGTPASCP
jgi:hypothetical protein